MATGAAAARDYDEHVAPSLLPVAATLLALAGIRDREVVVDVGCGTGLLTHPAAAAAGPGGRVYGVDPDPDLLAVARARRTSPVAWIRAGGGRLPFAAGSVDKVLCGVVLHRLRDVRPVLAEWARVLAPGGRVAVGAWASFLPSAAEDAVLTALSEHGVDPAACERRASLLAGDVAWGAEALPALLRADGLRVTNEAAGEATVPFVGAGAYAAWRLSLLPTASVLQAASDVRSLRASVAERTVALHGSGPVIVHSGIHYATASPA